MKLVLTLAARAPSDVLDAQIAFHLNAGVDLVVAAIEESPMQLMDLLGPYERAGYLRVLRDGADVRTRAARLAATEYGADWVINAEADEFWWPRAGSLKDVLGPIPPRYTMLQGLRREFAAGPDEDASFSERMTLRRSTLDEAGPPAAALRSVHRADPEVVVGMDGTVELRRPVPLRAWYPIEVFHFPTAEVGRTPGDDPPLVVDTRLRDALRTLQKGAETATVTAGSFALPEKGVSLLSFPTPDVVDDAAYAVECAAVGEVDLPRLEEYVTELEQRIGWLEQRFWPRVLRWASRLLQRG
jgi:hypothetical protein